MRRISELGNTKVLKNLLYSITILILLVYRVFIFSGCSCVPSPDDISVEPDCPDGRAAASGVTINASLSGIRPLGEEKWLRIRGNRDEKADLCFAVGAQVSFSNDIKGNGNVTVNITNLAHSLWSISITALSGGNHGLIKINQVLTPGATHTLTITSNSNGDIVANF